MIPSTVWLGVENPFLADAGNGHRLHQDVLPAYMALKDAAQEAGIDCQLVSSYRDFERQRLIWNRKWQGEMPLYNATGQLLDFTTLNDNEKIDAILTWSALPGTSRHHWGTDIDVYDKCAVEKASQKFELIDSEYRQGGPCFALAKWLDINAAKYGFHRPFLKYNGGVACELWHLSHTEQAHPFEAARSIDSLVATIDGADILGKDAVLSRIDELFHRYILNRGSV
ncbi:M15 family metallopeptidase [Alteromonas pelagimontana]|uniref:M15 family metallopeptidase n=1 Tax=Alteromonas pelagimontana TaxID=1858656 RepID=A0A6M4MAH4_9ALTE|nr:M15 family metallopeptidase [Alteromonas pelagimontana]QJR79670.1 M15 family metallopeptidase [Alteromonas pelagimontana]